MTLLQVCCIAGMFCRPLDMSAVRLEFALVNWSSAAEESAAVCTSPWYVAHVDSMELWQLTVSDTVISNPSAVTLLCSARI